MLPGARPFSFLGPLEEEKIGLGERMRINVHVILKILKRFPHSLVKCWEELARDTEDLILLPHLVDYESALFWDV